MAATAAAQAQPQQQQQLTPLDVLVQQLPRLPTPLQQSVVCKLQLCGAAVGAAIQKHCTAMLSLRFATYSIERLKAFVPWLAKNGCLLQSLALEVNVTAQHSSEAEAAIGTALQQAGAAGGSACCNGGAWYSPPGLQLRSYCLHPATVAGPALQQLDSYFLTQLELGRHAAYSCGFALEGLTRLCALRLYEDSADVLLPSLSGLTSLRRLALVDVASSSIAKLRFVGSGVQELQLSLARLKRSEAPPPGLCLSHLTALTKLTSDGKPLLIQAGDALPPSLRVLHVRDCMSAAPLLSLQELQELSMCASTTPAATLQQLGSSSSSSTGGGSRPAVNSSSSSGSDAGSSGSTNSSSSSTLQAVHLTYADMEAAAAAADGWPALPLVSLSLRAAEGCLPAATFHTFGQLRQLQHLDVCGGHGGFAAAAVLGVTQQGLASALRQMRSLQVLSLRGIGLLQASDNAAAATPPPPAAAVACTPAAAAGAAGGDTLAPVQDQAPAAIAADSSIANLCCSTQHLSISAGSADSSSAGQQALQPLLAAAASLPHLGCLTLASITCGQQPLVVDVPAAQALCVASGLTSLQLCDVGLTDAAANALVESGSLTQIRRLVLDSNLPLSAAVLPDGLASQLTGLRELSVLRTGIRASGAGFKARMLALHPGLTLKSSAR